MHEFSKLDILYGQESQISRSILESTIQKPRVSDDFLLAEDANLKPGVLTPVRVRLQKGLFPNVPYIMLGMLKHLEVSMRSCFAQAGVHILGKLFEYTDIEDIEKLNTEGRVDIQVRALNRGLSDVQLKGGRGFFRLYFRPSGQMITGKALFDIIQSEKLQIAGTYGQTRNLVGAKEPDGNTIDQDYEAIDLNVDEVDRGFSLKLKLNNNIYIPDNQKGVLILSKKNLVDILQPFDPDNPKHVHHNFNIGETAEVNFGDYFGMIMYQGYDGGSHHITSPCIDPGFTGPIRTEIVKGEKFNDFIELHIYHKDGSQIPSP